MTEQQYRVIADRENGDDPQDTDWVDGDRVTFIAGGSLVRIERPVPTTDEPQKPELVTLHLYRDTCVGGLFLSERELDRTLHEHVEALTIRHDRLPSPSVPTREQIAEASYYAEKRADYGDSWGDKWEDESEGYQATYYAIADAVLALLNGADR